MNELKLKVVGITKLAPEIKKFEFVAENGAALPAFEAGAHLDFVLENGLRRSYSLANDPADKARYVTAILRERMSDGGSVYMHDMVSVGDVLAAVGPSNNFPLAEDGRQHLLIAGGIGITPILAMCHRLKAIGADFHLHYCTKSSEETAFLDEIRQEFAGHITFHHDGGDITKGIKLNEVLGSPGPGEHLYICGPGGLIAAARAAATHWTDGTVHFELFTSAKTDEQRAAEAAGGDFEFEIELAQRGVTLTVPADKSILDVLWDNGVEVIYACEDGYCGSCTTGLISGKVDHRDEVLSDTDKETKIQVCVSRAASGEKKLVLDL
jgi:ferredoxin-NADP reductase